MAKLESRIEALEVQNLKLQRSLRIACVASVAIALAAVVGWSQNPVQDLVRAKRFQLVNADGKDVGALTISENQGSTLELRGPDGFNVVRLGSDESQNGGLQIFDRFHNVRLALAKSSVGPNYLEIGSGNNMLGRFQRTVAIGDFGAEGSGFAVFPADKSGARISATVNDAGNPMFKLGSDRSDKVDSEWKSEKGIAEMSFYKKSADLKTVESSLTVSAGKITAIQGGRSNSWPPVPPKKSK